MLHNYEYSISSFTLIFLISVILILLGWKLHIFYKNIILFYYRVKGKKAEKRAANILKKNNYKIIKEQEVIYGFLYENNKKIMYKVMPDFLVEKDGIRLLAEVKTGKSANIENRYTRRQLLEYSHLLNTDFSLLIDTDKEIIKTINFS